MLKICPYCNSKILGNTGVYANHIRWCKENPKFESINKKYKQKIGIDRQEKNIINEYRLNCKVCNQVYIICTTETNFKNSNYRKTCSSLCAHKLSIINCDNIKRTKNIKDSIIDGHIKHNTRRIEKIKECECCGKLYKTIRNTKYCSTSCATRHRYKNSIEYKELFYKYRIACTFKFSIKDYPDEFNYKELEKIGWYSAINRGNNINGISRDHVFSCKNGFDQLIDPYLVSHPANCKLITQRENSSKGTKSLITLDELITAVEIWNVKYGKYENKIDYSILKELKITRYLGN